MAYYAIAHTYGGNTRRGDNRRMGLMVEFASAPERDAWCEAGPSYRTEHGYREPLAATDADVAYFRRDGGIVEAADLQSPWYDNWR